MNPASRTRDIALVALVPLFFSTNVVIGRAVTAEVAPWTLAFLRWSGALLILLPFAVPALRENRDALVAQGGLIATLAFLGMWICGGLGSVREQWNRMVRSGRGDWPNAGADLK